MNPSDLLEEWESGESTGLRPQRIQRLRDDIQRITGQPVPHRVSEIEAWQSRLKSYLTRCIREAAEEAAGEDAEDK